MNPNTWHGLTFEQALKVLDASNWRGAVEALLVEVATSKHAAAKDRLSALQCLNEAVGNEVFAVNECRVGFIRDTLLDILQTGEKTGWLARRRQRKLRAQLAAARWMLLVGYQLVHNISVVGATRSPLAELVS